VRRSTLSLNAFGKSSRDGGIAIRDQVLAVLGASMGERFDQRWGEMGLVCRHRLLQATDATGLLRRR
jgi:hypothetical protein